MSENFFIYPYFLIIQIQVQNPGYRIPAGWLVFFNNQKIIFHNLVASVVADEKCQSNCYVYNKLSYLSDSFKYFLFVFVVMEFHYTCEYLWIYVHVMYMYIDTISYFFNLLILFCCCQRISATFFVYIISAHSLFFSPSGLL